MGDGAVLRFGQCSPRRFGASGWTGREPAGIAWDMYELYVRSNGVQYYGWGTVDDEGQGQAL